MLSLVGYINDLLSWMLGYRYHNIIVRVTGTSRMQILALHSTRSIHGDFPFLF
jgi:hypothetical protein